MSSTAPVATGVTAACVDSAASIVQSINDLREEQCLIDIQVEVSVAVLHLYNIFHAGITREGVWRAARFPGLKSLLTQQSELSRTTINLKRYSEG